MTTKSLNERLSKGCEGYLWRKSTILKRWKKGRYRLKLDDHLFHIECIEDDEFSIKFLTCDVKTVSSDRIKNAHDCLSFDVTFHKPPSILKSCNSKEEGQSHRFRASNVMELRTWLLCLGADACTPGLYSNGDPSSNVRESWTGKWDISHPAQAIHDEIEQIRNRASEQGPFFGIPDEPPPPYESVVRQIQEPKQIQAFSYQPPPSPVDLQIQNAMCMLTQTRRSEHDTYLPPYGPPGYCSVNLGYGAEVGLPQYIQKCWDPTTRKCFYMDHGQGITLWHYTTPDKEAIPTVNLETIPYGDGKKVLNYISGKALCNPSELQELAIRANSKPHGAIIKAQGFDGAEGCDGRSGSNGQNGEPGKKGYPGHEGEPGIRGKDGCQGNRGKNGRDGTSASDLMIFLTGNSKELQLSGTIEKQVSLGGNTNEHVLLINCHGGNGGKAGNGGQGGNGGHGGDGGKGGKGYDNYSCGNGMRGGDGGDGGNGGNGGPGGDGGNGGDAGSGGTVSIMAYDPSLFMLCEVDVTPGEPGLPGMEGPGGDRGHGGRGGKGGIGGNAGTKDDGSRGLDGISGNPGKQGADGIDGFPGENGSVGQEGNCGKLWFTLVDPTTKEIMLETGSRYDVRINGFEIHSEVDDGIFEPNERIFVTMPMVENIGGMFLPEGAEMWFPSTESVNMVLDRAKLPMMLQDSASELKQTFTGRVFDVPSPNKPGAFKATAEIKSRIELLGRPFDSGFRTETITVQYPIQIVSMSGPKQLGRGEQGDLQIQIKNISRLPYGDMSSQTGGLVMVKVRLDKRLFPYIKENQSPRPYTLRFNALRKDSVEIWIHNLGPGDTLTVALPFVMEQFAELFDRCLWQAELYLRGKLIEYNQEFIRVAPYFIPREPAAELLFITGPEITREMFVFWQQMFEALNLTVDFWDTERNEGLSVISSSRKQHEHTWVNKFHGRTVFYPYYNPSLLSGSDVATHFHGDSWLDCEHDDLDSSMVLITKDNTYKNKNKQLCAMFNHVLTENVPSARIKNENSAFGLFCSSSNGDKKMHKFVKKLEKADSRHHYCCFSKEFCSFISSEKFSSQHADIRRLPVDRSGRLLLSGQSDVLNLGADDPHNTPDATEIPLGSHFGQVLLALLFSLSIQSKARLLTHDGARDNVKFTTPWGYKYKIRELVGVCLEEYLAFDLIPGAKYPTRLESLVNAVRADPATFADSGVAEYIYVAVRSLLKKAKNNSEYKYLYPKAAKMSQEIANILKSKGDYILQCELEAMARQSVNSKERLHLCNLLDEHLFANSNRFTAKDSIYESSEVFV